jgi:hypothetical protein|tara:strand:- start:3067 stop:3330 length:264 start_codon:yes stop_codon:yes gene_type:complete
MTQLRFEGMFEEVDKELQERVAKIKTTRENKCYCGTCESSKKDESYSEVKQVIKINTLTEYFKKYSPESTWGIWLQNYYNVKVSLSV